ncbi:MAG: DUF4124 domain-containing protein [Pseudomonadota bacterium]
MSIRRFLLLFALLIPLNSMAVTYRYVDENGVVHYSDRPIEGAEEVRLQGAQTFSDGRRRSFAPPRTAAPSSNAQASEQVPTNYDGLEIIQPADDTTIWNSGGQVEVVFRLRPGLRQGHKVRIFLDGDPVPMDDDALNLVLQDVVRGTHEIRAVVEDANGNAVVRSDVTTFHYRQTFIRRN